MRRLEPLWKHLSDAYACMRDVAETGIMINGLFPIVGIRHCLGYQRGKDRAESAVRRRHGASPLLGVEK